MNNKDKTHCPRGHPLVPGNLRGGKRKHRECLTCHRNREGHRARSQGVRPRDPTRCRNGHDLTLPSAKINRGRCRLCHRDSERRRRDRNPEKLRAIAREYARAHKAEAKARFRAWKKANPNRVRLHHYRRRVRGPLAVEYVQILMGDPCAYCGGPANQIDHITAITAAGTSEWDNLTAACQRCNYSKNKHPLLRALLLQS